MTFFRVPSPSVYDPLIHEFYVQSVEDCLYDLDTIQGLLARHNPKAHVIVTVSLIPLFATFRTNIDVVSATMLSKSTLRVTAEYFVRKHANVRYVPSYEIVLQGAPDPFVEDNRHVKDEVVAQVMQAFEALFTA